MGGTYAFNRAGGSADGVNLAINGFRLAPVASPDHVYCLSLLGAGAPVRLLIQDSYHADNGGALEIAIYRVD